MESPHNQLPDLDDARRVLGFGTFILFIDVSRSCSFAASPERSLGVSLALLLATTQESCSLFQREPSTQLLARLIPLIPQSSSLQELARELISLQVDDDRRR